MTADRDGRHGRRRSPCSRSRRTTGAHALAAWSAAGAVAGASGFLVGGVVTQLAGWRLRLLADATALVLLPLSVLVVAGALVAAPLVVRAPRERVAPSGWAPWPPGPPLGTALRLLVVGHHGLPGPGSAPPTVGWAVAVALAAGGSAAFPVLRPARPAQDLHTTTPDPDQGHS